MTRKKFSKVRGDHLYCIPAAFLLSALALVLLMMVCMVLELKKSLNKLSGDHDTVVLILGPTGLFGSNLRCGGSISGSSGLHDLSRSTSPSPCPEVACFGSILAGPRRPSLTLLPSLGEGDFELDEDLCVGLEADAPRDLRVTGLEVAEFEVCSCTGGTNSSSSPSYVEDSICIGLSK